jgi:restriction endonuclease
MEAICRHRRIKLNDNFAKKEFQELWNRINHKYAYKVSFDSQELIDKAVIAIDSELEVTQLTYIITQGTQKEDLRKEDFESGEMLNLKSATKPLNVLIAFTRPLITEFADNLNLKHPLLPTISPYPTM